VPQSHLRVRWRTLKKCQWRDFSTSAATLHEDAGCWYHYAQAIIKRTNKIGLKEAYGSDADVQNVHHCESAAAAAFCHSVGTHTESLHPRVDSSSSSEDADEASQAPVPAVTTSAVSEPATAAAASAFDDCCEVCLVAPCVLALHWCHANMLRRFCEVCAMRVLDTAAGCTDDEQHYIWETVTLKQVPRCPPLLLDLAFSDVAMSGLAFSVISMHTQKSVTEQCICSAPLSGV